MKALRSWIGTIILGVISSAIYAFLFAPDQQVQLGSLSTHIMTIPLFFLLGAAALALFGLYLIVHLIEILAVKLHILDFWDAGS
jgi:hypothetical protein